MDVTYSAHKSRENEKAHGISLAAAADFDFDSAVVDVDDRHDYGELRFNALGFYKAALYALTYVDVADDAIRAISFRKASPVEERYYAENT